MKIFIVCIDQGAYSDYRREEIAAFRDKAAAEDVVNSIKQLATLDKKPAEDAAALIFAAQGGIELSPHDRPYYVLTRRLGELGKPTNYLGAEHNTWYKEVYRPKIDALAEEVSKQLRLRMPLLATLEQRLPEVNLEEILFDRYDTAEPDIVEMELR